MTLSQKIKKELRRPQPGDYIPRILILFHLLAFSLFGLFYCFFICEPGSAGRSLAFWPILMFICSVAGIIIGVKKETKLYKEEIRYCLRTNNTKRLMDVTLLEFKMSPLGALTTGAAIGVGINLMVDRKTARGLAIIALILAIILKVKQYILRKEIEKYYEEESAKREEKMKNAINKIIEEGRKKHGFELRLIRCPNCKYPDGTNRYLYLDMSLPTWVYRCQKCNFFVRYDNVVTEK